MAPFESRETLEPTAYDGPVSAPRRHSRLRYGCDGATSARPANVQRTGTKSCFARPAKLLHGLSGSTVFVRENGEKGNAEHEAAATAARAEQETTDTAAAAADAAQQTVASLATAPANPPTPAAPSPDCGGEPTPPGPANSRASGSRPSGASSSITRREHCHWRGGR